MLFLHFIIRACERRACCAPSAGPMATCCKLQAVRAEHQQKLNTGSSPSWFAAPVTIMWKPKVLMVWQAALWVHSYFEWNSPIFLCRNDLQLNVANPTRRRRHKTTRETAFQPDCKLAEMSTSVHLEIIRISGVAMFDLAHVNIPETEKGKESVFPSRWFLMPRPLRDQRGLAFT